jgi:hypothetical protein
LPLKDTLKMLREREQREKQALDNRPNTIQEWKDAVASLFAEIRRYLEEYEKDGSLSFSEETTRLTEESLGSYGVPLMKITAGPAVILVEPVGRLVIGAFGRVDMHRQGQAGEQQRLMFLRMPKSTTDATPIWHLRMPVESRSSVPLTKEAIEQAIDFLLR